MDLKQFCGDEDFFDFDKVINTTDPEFSNCFERTVFDLTPCGFLLLAGIPYIIIKRKSFDSYIPVSNLFIAKVVFALLLCLLALIDFGQAMWKWTHNYTVPYVNILSPILVALAMGKAAFFIHFERLKGIRSSSILTLYWLLYLFLWILVFRTQVKLLLQNEPLTNEQLWRCVTFFISYAFVFAQSIMCFFVDKPPAFPPNDPFADKPETSEQSQGQKPEKQEKLKPSPEDSASFLSQIFFEWFTGMIYTGYKRPIVDEDLWDLNRSDKAGRVSRHFLHIWNAEKNKCRKQNERLECTNPPRDEHSINNDEEVLIEQPSKKKKYAPSLFKTLCKTFGPALVFSTFLKLISDTLLFVSPQLLSGLLTYVQSDAPSWQGYLLAAAMFVAAMVQVVVFQYHFHITFRVGFKLRSAIVAVVYRKSLALSNTARKESTIGEITNLMSVDSQRLMDLVPYLYAVVSSPYQMFLALFFLWRILGPSTLAGLGVMVLLMPINAVIASKAFKYQKKQMELKDERIKLMNEILNGIKVLKMYAWEMSFREKINFIRNKELRVLRNFAFLNAAISFTWTCAPFMVSLSTFAVYVLSDSANVLDANKIFVSISLFNILQFPLILLPFIISECVQAKVSLNRLQKFVNADELDPDSVDRVARPGPAISVEDGTFAWERDGDPTLHNIDLDVPQGSLIAVVGQVGCGKSSLLSSLLGNMEKISGNVSVKGDVAYVAQQAWIQNLTVRDNILFGKPLDVCKYQDTIEACELKEDFEMLPASDMTEIGERGINLSGGQKQRVSIARAVYHDSDVYLLDDPLSAVDAHVGKNLFDNVLGPNGILKSKTRVLVTHSVAFLPQIDKIYVLVNGKISETGTYDELLEQNGAFAEFLRNYANNESDDTEEEEEDEDALLEEEPVEDVAGSPITGSEATSPAQIARQYSRQRSRKSGSDHDTSGKRIRKRSRLKSTKDRECKLPEKKNKDKDADKLMTEETAEVGNVKASVIYSYMRSLGVFATVITLLGYTLYNAATVYSNIWLSQWAEDPIVNGTQSNSNFRLAIYGALGFANAVFILGTALAFSIGAVYASTHLHNKMLDNIMRVPMAFFDTTPLGRIVNRFGKDVDIIDEVIPHSISGFMECSFMVLSTLFVIIYSTPIFAAVVVPLLIFYYFVQRFYVRTSRQLKRLESISRSPIFSQFSETLAGVSTIRAYQLQKTFIKKSEDQVDVNQRAYFPNITSNRWLGVRMEFLGNFIVFFSALFAVIERDQGTIVAGTVGLSVSYALQITQILNWLVRTASEAETNIVAVERVEEYAKVEQEAPLIIERKVPPAEWPLFGDIRFENYSTRYREGLDLVVKNITLPISGGEKIGVVGRTGAGKSSLTLALFRIIEATEGRIRIDGLDIGEMGLHSLRSKISIIPQDPVLFSGPLRMNLDPFDAYTDDDLWKSLELSHLKNFVSSLAKKLDHEVSEGGENLSVGQRQLVCLARALLRKSKILVLDEATAAVDLETDDLIQTTIREQFAGCTTFTIAHRLNTIMDSTKVLVMDAGKVAEYNSPQKLLEAKGIFYSMAKDAGLAS